MKKICLKILVLTGLSTPLMAVPATPFLITFEQPDGSRF